MIEICKVEPDSIRPYKPRFGDLAASSPPPLAELRPWLEAFAEQLSTASSKGDVDGGELVESIEGFDFAGPDGADVYENAARISLAMAEENGNDHSQMLAIAAGFYHLKRHGLEAGRAPARHWRLNRLLNAGSRAVDAMIGDPLLRARSLRTLLFRTLNAGWERSRFEAGGVTSTMVCPVDWDMDTESPMRRELPRGGALQAGTVSSSMVIDWLLEELVSRSLTTLTLGSVIEERSGRAEYVVDDLLGEWLAGLGADEARFVAGALFLPASIGGWPPEHEPRVLDALAVAQKVAGEFAPQESRFSRYGEYLRSVDNLRRLPEGVSPTFEIDDEGQSWRGRFALTVHPVRCEEGAEEGYFNVETGFYFEDERRRVPSWPESKKSAFLRRLRDLITEEDDECFTHFGQDLNQLVDRINRAPGAREDEPSGDVFSASAKSPLWSQLSVGIDEVWQALQKADVDRLAGAFRRWTFACAASTMTP